MARLNGKFISGVAGPVIFKKVGNKQFVTGKCSKPQIDMTEATYNAAFIFGRASTLAAYIRNKASDIIRYYDSGMISKLTGECNRIVQKTADSAFTLNTSDHDYFERLNGFEFNIESPVRSYLFAQPKVSTTEEKVVIDFPEMDIPKDLAFAPKAKCCTVAVKVLLLDLHHELLLTQDIQSFDIQLNANSYILPKQQLTFEGAAGSLCIVYLSLFYTERTFAGNIILNNQQLSPCAILKATFCPGIAVEQEGWRSMNFNEKKKRKNLRKKTSTTMTKKIKQ